MALKYVVTKQVFGFDKDKKQKYVAGSIGHLRTGGCIGK